MASLIDRIDIKNMTRDDKIEYLYHLQTEKDKRIITLAETFMRKSKSQRLNIEKEWKENSLMRQGKRIGGYYHSDTKLSSKEVHNSCNTLASRLRDILFGEMEWFNLKAPADVLQEVADIFKDYMKYQFDTDGIYETGYTACDEFVTYGKVYIKGVWGINRKKHKQIYWTAKRKEKYPGVYSGIEYKKEILNIDESIKDNIHFSVVQIERLYRDATIPKLEDNPIIIEEMEVGWNHLKNLSKSNMGDDGLYDIRPEHKQMTTNATKLNTVTKTIIEKSNVNVEGETLAGRVSNRYKLWQLYFWFDIDKDGYEELCMSTLLVSGNDTKVVIQKPIEFPYLHGKIPYLEADFEKDSRLAYGQGVPAIAKDSHIVLSDNLARMHDNATYRTNNMWIMDKNAGITPSFLVSEPNKVIGVNSWPGIQALRPEDMIVSHMSIQKFHTEDIRQAVGTPGTVQGLPTRYGTTAKETSQMLAQANILITDVIKRFERGIVEPMLEMAASMVMQFIEERQIVEVIGKKGFKSVDFQPWQIHGPCKFMATGSIHIQNRLMVSQQLLNLLAQAAHLPPGTLKTANILKRWIEILDLTKNPDEFINTISDEDLIKPSDENVLMNQGQRVVIQSKEDKMAHLAIHLAGLQICPPESYELYREHIKETEEAIWLEQEQKSMMGMGGQGGYMPTGKQPLQHMPQTEKGVMMQNERKGVSRNERMTPAI